MRIDRVSKFRYLGMWLSENWTSDIEIKSRIEQARQAFLGLRRVFSCSDFDLGLRLRLSTTLTNWKHSRRGYTAEYLGHVMRNEKYEYLQIESKIEGRRGMGRKKLSWLWNIRQWTGVNDVQTLIHTAMDREQMENVIANIHQWVASEEEEEDGA